MPDAPNPITSPPAQSFQPYDATADGTDDTAPQGGEPYAANGRDWVKIADGGAADWATGKITGEWPGDGTSNGGQWKQC